MAQLTRREEREKVFEMLFESEFRPEESAEEVYAVAMGERELEGDGYIQSVYLGIRDKQEEIDTLIGKHAKGWKTGRLSRVSRSIIRLCVYEMCYVPDVPNSVAINEAVELAKKFDTDKARPFINGVLNSVKDELEAVNK